MNHSKIHDNVFHGPSKRKMHAIRNTDIGEELLCNYLSYSDPDDFHVRNIINEHEGGVGLVSIDELETNFKYQVREEKLQNYKKTQ